MTEPASGSFASGKNPDAGAADSGADYPAQVPFDIQADKGLHDAGDNSGQPDGSEDSARPRPRRRFGFRFRMTLLAGVIIAAAVAWFIGAQYNTAVRQRATAELLTAGAKIEERSHTQAPQFLISMLGEDFFTSPVAFTFTSETPPQKLEPLRRLPVESLDLSLVPVGDEGVAQIAHVKGLRELFLKEAGITDEGGAALSSLTKLEKLELSGNAIGPETAKAIGKLPELTRLWLNQTQTGDEELLQISNCSKIQMLSLNKTLVTSDGILPLLRLPELRSLHLGGAAIDDEGLRHIGAMTYLSGSLDLSDCLITDKGIRQLAGLTYLRSLDLTGCKLSTEAVAQLRRTLPKCQITHP